MNLTVIPIGFKYSYCANKGEWDEVSYLCEVIGKRYDMPISSSSDWKNKEEVLQDKRQILQILIIPTDYCYDIRVNEISEEMILKKLNDDFKLKEEYQIYEIITE